MLISVTYLFCLSLLLHVLVTNKGKFLVVILTRFGLIVPPSEQIPLDLRRTILDSELSTCYLVWTKLEEKWSI